MPSGDAPSKLSLCSNVPPRPPWPPPCPQLLPPLTSPCASFTVFMNTAIPIAAVLIVSGPSLPHWAGEGQVESIQVPSFSTRISKVVSRGKGERRWTPPYSTQTGSVSGPGDTRYNTEE